MMSPVRCHMSRRADTTAVVVGEGGDIPGGLLLVVRKDNRTPGTAVVHDREIEDGEVQYNRCAHSSGLNPAVAREQSDKYKS